MNDSVYPVFAYGKWGLIDSDGNQVVPITYNYSERILSSFQRDIVKDYLIIIVKDNKYGVLDLNKRKEIVPTIYEDIRGYDGYWCVQKKGLWYLLEKGLLYKIGEYNSVSFINEEFIQLEELVSKSNSSKAGLNHGEKTELVYSISKKNILLKSKAHIFYNDRAIVYIDEKYGFINRSFELVIPAIYDYVKNFENNFAYVTIGENEYYIDMTGQQVISGPFYHPDYSNENFHNDIMFMEGIWDGLVCYEKDGFVGLKGTHNRIITPPIYNIIYLVGNHSKKYIEVVKNGKYGVIDKNGNIIIACEYDYLWIPSDIEDIFIIGNYYMEGDLWKRECGIIDARHKQIISPKYWGIYTIKENVELAIIQIKDKCQYKYGVLNIYSLEIVIPPIFDSCQFFGDLFLVFKDNKWGYLDLDGREMMKINQDFDHSIFKEYSYTKIDGEWKWIGERDELTPPAYVNRREITFMNWGPVVKPIL